ncbi:MAG: hypothetical protein JWN38_891 [Candidatus Saccharibacteria bacterium]|nr:hypothetical protein [Candidatus Saccharibacteria bacterium]
MHHGSINRMAVMATLHCLGGCAIGEVLGLIVGTVLNFNNWQTLLVSVALAFVFGYSLSVYSLTKAGMAMAAAAILVLAADTLSITSMEIADTSTEALIPGAMNAGLNNLVFWTSMLASLVVAFLVAWPVNRYLLSKGKGHALTHQHLH